MNAIDYVLGFPEGGVIPAFAFAHLVDRPLVLSTRFVLEGPGVISFEEPHSGLGKTHYIRGLREGDRVVVIETRSPPVARSSTRSAAPGGGGADRRGRRAPGWDDPAMWQSMKNEDISLVVTSRLPGVYRTLLGVEASP